MKKIQFICLSLIFTLFCVGFSFVGCNANTITVNFSFDTNVSMKIKNNSNNIESFFTDSEYTIPSVCIEAGGELNITPLYMVKNGYKVDEIYYLDQANKKIIIYSYIDGEYEQSFEGGGMLTQMDAINGYNYYNGTGKKTVTLPNYDITIIVETSKLDGHYHHGTEVKLYSNNAAHGSVVGSGVYEIHTELNIKAIPNSGYAFDRWSDGSESAERNIYLYKSTIELIAYFKIAE